jgi:hypothetical protein
MDIIEHRDPAPLKMLGEEFWKTGDIKVFTMAGLRERDALSNEDWVDPIVQLAMQASQDIRSNLEELDRLKIEAQRVHMWMIDEPNYIRHRIASRPTPKGMHWPWVHGNDLSLASTDDPTDTLDTLDLWYAQEKLQSLKLIHGGIEHDMAGVINRLPEWNTAAKRKDLGRGSPWFERVVSNIGMGGHPTTGDGKFLPIPFEKQASWPSPEEVDEQFYHEVLPPLMSQWLEESLSDGNTDDHTDLDTAGVGSDIPSVSAQTPQVAEEELNDEELEQYLGITIATWQAYS